MIVLVELVSHCWAVELPQYASALCYQLSSFVLHKPMDCNVQATVCHCRSDPATRRVLDYFAEHLPSLSGVELSPPELGRRSIGRNLAALRTTADVVWFADVDQVYRDGCLNRLAGLEWPEGALMIHPKRIMIHKDHETGGAALKRVDPNDPGLIDVDPIEFVPKRYNRAIGGVQIVKGDFARMYGYLSGDLKWQQPRRDGRPFADFRDDVAYRKFCSDHGDVVGVDLSGMYRLRHTRKTHPD